jgi:hypothetical protein
MAKRGRPTKTQSILNSMKRQPEPKVPIADEMFLPNHSGISKHREFTGFLEENYLALDGSNANTTINVGPENIRTTGNMVCGEFDCDDIEINGKTIYSKNGGELLLNSVGSGDGTVRCYGEFWPNLTSTYDLGSSSLKWKDLYLSEDISCRDITGRDIGCEDITSESVSIEDTARPTLTITDTGNPSIRLFPAVANERIDLSSNANFNGSSWVRDDTGKDAGLLAFTSAGQWIFFVAGAAANPISWTEVTRMDSSEWVVNEGGTSMDFRVESNTEDKLFYVDGGLDVVRMGDYDTNYAQFSKAGLFNFVGTGGLPYAQVWAHNAGAGITSVAQNDWDQITAFDTDGDELDANADHNNDHITIGKAGRYLVTWQWSGTGPAASHDWDFHIAKNNRATDYANTSSHITTPVAQNLVSCAGSGILDLANADTVELWVQRLSAGANIVLTTENCSISVVHIGGT